MYSKGYKNISQINKEEKNLAAMQEMQVLFLGWEDPLEKEMATHSNILAWRIPWTEEPGGLQLMGSQRVRHDCATEHGCWCLIKGFPPWFLSFPFFVFSLKRL